MGRLVTAGLGILALGIATFCFAQQGTPPRTLPPGLTNPEPGQPLPNPIQPVSGTNTAPTATTVTRSRSRIEQLDLNKLNALQKQMVLSTQRATVWLARMHGKNGRFIPGWQPELKSEVDTDHFLHQAMATFTLSRAARFSGEEKLASLARETLLSLLDETFLDEKTQIRFTPLPSVAINRLAAAGLLVAAINELPDPRDDLLTKSEQLCAYIRLQVRPEGWLSFTDTPPDRVPADSDAMQNFPGMALYGLQLSQRHKPAEWKSEVLRKAVAFYLPWWRTNKSVEFIPWQTAAYTEAYLSTRDPQFANAVYEMNDWLTSLQYSKIDPRNPGWYGGFRTFEEGRIVESTPTVRTGSCAESLAEACRLARHQGDVTRCNRYAETTERALQFLTTLQYTEASTQHFADWYRPRLVGGFHGSLQDGKLRLEYTQIALSALLQYLDQVVLR